MKYQIGSAGRQFFECTSFDRSSSFLSYFKFSRTMLSRQLACRTDFHLWDSGFNLWTSLFAKLLSIDENGYWKRIAWIKNLIQMPSLELLSSIFPIKYSDVDVVRSLPYVKFNLHSSVHIWSKMKQRNHKSSIISSGCKVTVKILASNSA